MSWGEQGDKSSSSDKVGDEVRDDQRSQWMPESCQPLTLALGFG